MTHIIKVNYTNGDEKLTNINGTADEISKHYSQINIMAWKSGEPQAKRIEFLESEYLKEYSSYIYLFIDFEGNGLLQ
ncbi:hypothetical protein [Paenibacillus oleatilyticus]|uniref:hypothetical protein n=1 Tax=Paenibacillus oleatilyticus TaxID=2594886 RepID=UPI001C1FF0ED|nr:hypothetical protein [Paenibacillus oleatilyticus]MBU7316118.1 hypothetical protein [Paenibacillus oleatilyticus]